MQTIYYTYPSIPSSFKKTGQNQYTNSAYFYKTWKIGGSTQNLVWIRFIKKIEVTPLDQKVELTRV
jgi:hypothetical protein